MILRVTAFAALFCFTVLGQVPQSSAAKMQSGAAKTPEIISSLTLESFQQIVQGMGFEATRDKDEKGNLQEYFMFRAEGYKVGAQVPGPDFIWLHNVFTDVATLENINEWNAVNRFCRASWNPKDKTLLLETEIVVHGGVTRENIEIQVKQFRDSVASWARFVIDHNKKEATASISK